MKDNQKESAFWIKHDSNANNDERLLIIQYEFEWRGYGMYWRLIEALRESSDYTLSKTLAKLYLRCSKEEVNVFLDKCFDIGLFIVCEENDDRFYSESLMRRVAVINDIIAKRTISGRKGGEAKANAKQNGSKNVSNPYRNEVNISEMNRNEVNGSEVNDRPAKKNKAMASSQEVVELYLIEYDSEQEVRYGYDRIKALAKTFWDDMQKSEWCYGEKNQKKLKDWAAHARKYYSNEPKYSQTKNSNGSHYSSDDNGKMAGVSRPAELRAALNDPLQRRGGRPLREGSDTGDAVEKLLQQQNLP